MISYLLLIALILYGEFSKDINTRFIARVLYYSYTFTIFLMNTIPPEIWYAPMINGVFVFGIGYCIVRCRNWISGIFFSAAAVAISLNSVSLSLNEPTLLLQIPLYAEYSHVIIRESILIGLANFAIWKVYKDKSEDAGVSAFVACLWLFETGMI
jgi:uncharacterized membrane protein YcgQ (UPF0703/DUF1980 family)